MIQLDSTSKKLPNLRFIEFKDKWEVEQVKDILARVSMPVDVEATLYYKQIGIRSHGKGIFYKEKVRGASLGNKRVFWVQPNTFIVNIVFAWEQAVAKTTANENGMIASHRFPMYAPIEKKLSLDYILYFFLTDKGKYLLGLASPGGAGRNKTLGQNNFEELVVTIPHIDEQKKIVFFLKTIDDKIDLLQNKISMLKKYKKGVMQALFSQKIRFLDKDRNKYADWQKNELTRYSIRLKVLASLKIKFQKMELINVYYMVNFILLIPKLLIV